MDIVKKTAKICTVILIFSAVLYFLYLSRIVLLYLFVAAILAIAVNPLVRKLQKLKVKRALASVLILIILLLLLLGVLTLFVIPLVQQIIAFAENLPTIIAHISTNNTFIQLNSKYHLLDDINQFTSNTSATILGTGTSALFVLSNIISIFSTIVIILVFTFLLSIQGEKLWAGLVGFLKGTTSIAVERIGKKIAVSIGGFISGNLFISLIAGIVTYILLLLTGIPYALPLAVLVAVFDLIPLVGAAIATIIVGLIALTQGLLITVIVVGVLLVYQFIEGHVIQPLVYSRSVNLSALLVVVVTVLGGEIYGVIGILLAIPLAAIGQILAVELYDYFKRNSNA